jgi:hypothetical protein
MGGFKLAKRFRFGKARVPLLSVLSVWDIGGAMKRLMLFAGALLLFSSTARTQQVDIASDVELRVAYCLGAMEHEQAAFLGPKLLEGMPADSRMAKALREGAQSNADRRARLLGYLQARGLLSSVRSTAAKSGVIAAKRRGWDDAVERLAVVYACIEKCPLESRACTDDCRETKGNPAVDAIKRCTDNDPLPY